MMKKKTTMGRAAALFAALFVLASCQDQNSKDFEIQAGTLVKYTGTATEVRIPSNVTAIGEGAFAGLTDLSSVTIPLSVKTIKNSAFSRCTGLTGITIPASVKFIEHAAFEGCTGLTSVIIPTSVTKIENAAFAECTSLTSVLILSSGTEIGPGAFNQCDNLTNVHINADVVFPNDGSPRTFIGDLVAVYNRNEKKAGTYVRAGDNWTKK